MKKSILLFIVATLGITSLSEARHTGAAVAGGILGGVLLTKALERPRHDVVVVDSSDSYAEDYALRRRERELKKYERDLQRVETKLDQAQEELAKRERELDKREKDLDKREKELDKRKATLDKQEAKLNSKAKATHKTKEAAAKATQEQEEVIELVE